jgi:hypothetical protein
MTIMMRINVSMLLALNTLFACGMEKEKHWSITFGNTTINLNKENMFDIYVDAEKKVDIIVIGQYQREQCGGIRTGGNVIGSCYGVSGVYFKTKKENNNCRVVTWNSHVKPVLWYFPKPDNMHILEVSEPIFYWYNGWHYRRLRLNDQGYCDLDENGRFKEDLYQGDQMVVEACKDLSFCYKNALAKGLKLLNGKKYKSIALSALSTEYKDKRESIPQEKAAPVAMQAIFEYIKNNPHAYDRIELFVQKKCAFDLYKELLMQQRGKENILLLYCAQDHCDTIFSSLPRDVIHYISRLL